MWRRLEGRVPTSRNRLASRPSPSVPFEVSAPVYQVRLDSTGIAKADLLGALSFLGFRVTATVLRLRLGT